MNSLRSDFCKGNWLNLESKKQPFECRKIYSLGCLCFLKLLKLITAKKPLPARETLQAALCTLLYKEMLTFLKSREGYLRPMISCVTLCPLMTFKVQNSKNPGTWKIKFFKRFCRRNSTSVDPEEAPRNVVAHTSLCNPLCSKKFKSSHFRGTRTQV